MALPLLPEAHIQPAYDELAKLATSPALLQLMSYVSGTWINNDVWSPANISVYSKEIRTNNDLEGWHRRVNGLARRGNLPLYLLISLLHKEAKNVRLHLRMASDGKVLRRTRPTYVQLNDKVKELWKQYETTTMTTSKFLRAASFLQVPSFMG